MIKDRSGSVAIIFALALLPVMGVVGLAVDLGRLNAARSQMQSNVDASALAGAQAISMTDQERTAFAQTIFISNLKSASAIAGTTANVSIANAVVSVYAEARIPTLVIQVLTGDYSGSAISASASAPMGSTVSGLGQACLLALNQNDSWGVNMGTSSGLDANCGLYVNNSLGTAIKLGSGKMTTAFTAVVGTWDQNQSFTYTPAPVHVTAPLADPLAG